MGAEITPVIVAAGVVAHDVGKRVLGPTADLLGQDLSKGYEWTKQNLGRVLAIANEKLGAAIDLEGGVHPRVARITFREAQDVNDQFGAEYFGGILASARGPDSHDDSAVPFLKTLERLSVSQIKFHFLTHFMYSEMLASLPESKQADYWKRYGLYIELEEIATQLGFEQDLRSEVTGEIRQLINEGILGENYTLRTNQRIAGIPHEKLWREGLYVTFSEFGLRLFQRALGQRGIDPNLLPITDIRSSVSASLQPQLDHVYPELFKVPYQGVEAKLSSQVEDIRLENEGSTDDLKSEIEELEKKLEKLESKSPRKKRNSD